MLLGVESSLGFKECSPFQVETRLHPCMVEASFTWFSRTSTIVFPPSVLSSPILHSRASCHSLEASQRAFPQAVPLPGVLFLP